MIMRNFNRERARQLALERTSQSDALIEQIRPLLAHRNPTLQGCVIAELLAIFIGGHHPTRRQEMLDATVEMAVTMIALHDPWKGGK
jgi:hypothetical protein